MKNINSLNAQFQTITQNINHAGGIIIALGGGAIAFLASDTPTLLKLVLGIIGIIFTIKFIVNYIQLIQRRDNFIIIIKKLEEKQTERNDI